MSESESVPSSRLRSWLLLGMLGLGVLFAYLRFQSNEVESGDEEKTKTQRMHFGNSKGDKGENSKQSSWKLGELLAKASVSGRILDAKGNGIVGATVCARRYSQDVPQSNFRVPKCTKSQNNGAYTLEGLHSIPVGLRLDAWAPKLAPQTYSYRDEKGDRKQTIYLKAEEEKTGIDIVLDEEGLEVRGIIKDISGGPVAGAIVRVLQTVSVSDDEGKFLTWAAPGEVWIHAWAEGYSEAERQSTAPGPTVELFLTPESVLQGRVVHAQSGKAIAGAKVWAMDPGSLKWSLEEPQNTNTDQEGRFRIDSLEPGTYKVAARSDQSYGLSLESVHLAFGEVSDEVEVRVHDAFSVEGELVIVGEEGEEGLDTSDGKGGEKPCPWGEVTLKEKTNGESRRDEVERFDSGAVHVEAVFPGEYDVTLNCPGYLAVEDKISLAVPKDGGVDFQRWEFKPALSIRGKIVVAGGGELHGPQAKRTWVGASLKLDSAADPRGQMSFEGAQVEEDGTFKIEGLLPNTYKISVNSEDLPTPKEPTEVTLKDKSVEGIVIELPAGGTVKGTVRGDDGQPIKDARVEAQSRDERWAWGQKTARTDDEGNYQIKDLRVGDYRIVATRGQWWGEETMRAPGQTDDDLLGESLTVEAGQIHQVDLVVESQKGEIRGQVVDADGGPVGDAFLSVSKNSDAAGANEQNARAEVRWGEWNRQPVLTDSEGKFVIEGLSEGKYTVRAHRKSGGEAIAEKVKVGDSVRLEIRETGEVSGRVVMVGGGAPEHVTVRLVDPSQWLEFEEPLFRSDGRFRLSEIPAGSYELIASSPTGRASEKLVLKASEKRENIELQLAAKVTVRGKLVDFDSGKPVQGYRVLIRAWHGGDNFEFSEGGEKKDVSDASGEFEVENVASGTVMLLIVPRSWDGSAEYGYSQQSRKLPASPRVQDLGNIQMIKNRRKESEPAGDFGWSFKERAPDDMPEDIRFVVSHLRPGGPAMKAGIKVGDEIVRVDGQDIRGENLWKYYGLTNVLPETSVLFGLSDGRKIKITAEAKP